MGGGALGGARLKVSIKKIMMGQSKSPHCQKKPKKKNTLGWTITKWTNQYELQ